MCVQASKTDAQTGKMSAALAETTARTRTPAHTHLLASSTGLAMLPSWLRKPRPLLNEVAAMRCSTSRVPPSATVITTQISSPKKLR